MFSTQKSSSETRESDLSKAQSKILQEREKQFQSIFFPELQKALKAFTGPTAETDLGVATTQSLQRGFKTGEEQFGKAMAQRGLRGSGSETLGLANMASARSSALADAMLNAKLSNQSRLLQILQMGGALAPTPTTAAPIGQSTSAGGWTASLGE